MTHKTISTGDCEVTNSSGFLVKLLPRNCNCDIIFEDRKLDLTGNQTSLIKFFEQFSCIRRVKGRQVYSSLLRAPVGNLITQPCKNENQYLECLAEFLRGK